jgi:hypothetical protein
MWGCSLRHDASDLWLGAHGAYAGIPGPVGAENSIMGIGEGRLWCAARRGLPHDTRAL